MKNNNLKDIYDTIAEKYYLSRNKHRNDGIHVLNEIQKYGKKEISILEFGCGGGRCIKYLNENIKGIIKIRKKRQPQRKFYLGGYM